MVLMVFNIEIKSRKDRAPLTPRTCTFLVIFHMLIYSIVLRLVETTCDYYTNQSSADREKWRLLNVS